MILKKTGSGEFRELTTDEREALFVRCTGVKQKDIKRAMEFILLGANAKIGIGDEGSVGAKVYPASKSVLNTFNAYEDGTTVTYAYAHEVVHRQQGGVTMQVLMPTFAAQLGMQFKRDKKKITVPMTNLDRALYLLIYPECNKSPFKGNKPAKYELFEPQVKAKSDLARMKKEAALQNLILNELDEDTLRSYVGAKGRKDSVTMSIEEAQVIVLNDAKRDPDAFNARINSGVTNVRADVVAFISRGLLVKKQYQGKNLWEFGKGANQGEILFDTHAAADDVTAVTNKLFEDTSLFERIRTSFYQLEGNNNAQLKPKEKTAAPVVEEEVPSPSFVTHSKMAKVEEYERQGKISYFVPQKRVHLIDKETGKKKAEGGELFTATNQKSWKQEFAEYLADNPQVEVLIEE